LADGAKEGGSMLVVRVPLLRLYGEEGEIVLWQHTALERQFVALSKR